MENHPIIICIISFRVVGYRLFRSLVIIKFLRIIGLCFVSDSSVSTLWQQMSNRLYYSRISMVNNNIVSRNIMSLLLNENEWWKFYQIKSLLPCPYQSESWPEISAKIWTQILIYIKMKYYNRFRPPIVADFGLVLSCIFFAFDVQKLVKYDWLLLSFY